MNKREIKEMGNEALLASLLNVTTELTKQENTRGGATLKSTKECKWMIEELSLRFNLDVKLFSKKFDIEHWWEE